MLKATMSESTVKNHALVLSSGGVLGAYEIGVIKALFKSESATTDYKSLNPGIVCGSSIGAFNAAFLGSQLDETNWVTAVECLEQVWLDSIAPTHGRNGAYRIRGNPLELLDVCNLFSDPGQYPSQVAKDAGFWSKTASNES